MSFDLLAWRRYFQDSILKRYAPPEPEERLARAERLYSDRTLDAIWSRLGSDVKPYGGPPSVDPYDALHNVVACVVTSMGVIHPPNKEALDAVLGALRKLRVAYQRHPNIGDHVTQVEGVRLPSSAADVARMISLLEAHDWKRVPRPLMPTTMSGDSAARNWLALYMRHWIIGAYFHHPHHEAIARLIECAYPEWPPFADGAKSVRSLKNW